jgi:hypothetical protein
VEAAVRAVLDAGYRTPDLNRGQSKYITTTAEMGALVAESIAEVADMRHAYHAV